MRKWEHRGRRYIAFLIQHKSPSLHRGHLLISFPAPFLALVLHWPYAPTTSSICMADPAWPFHLWVFVMHFPLRPWHLPISTPGCLFILLQTLVPLPAKSLPSLSLVAEFSKSCWAPRDSLCFIFSLLTVAITLVFSLWSGWGRKGFLSFHYQNLAKDLSV